MTDKQIKEELKQVATNLGNIEFTVEDELKFCKEVLKRKEQECERLKREAELLKQYKGSKQASYERMQIEWNKAVSQNRDLLKQVGDWQDKYNQLKTENKQAEQKLERIKEICKNGAYDKFNMPLDELSVILKIIDEV